MSERPKVKSCGEALTGYLGHQSAVVSDTKRMREPTADAMRSSRTMVAEVFGLLSYM